MARFRVREIRLAYASEGSWLFPFAGDSGVEVHSRMDDPFRAEATTGISPFGQISTQGWRGRVDRKDSRVLHAAVLSCVRTKGAPLWPLCLPKDPAGR
jgi:hypothetical protein